MFLLLAIAALVGPLQAGPALPEGLAPPEDDENGHAAPDGPALPEGLEGDEARAGDGPALPEGIGGEEAQRDDAGPALPSGLEPETPKDAEPADAEAHDAGPTPMEWLNLTGFWEVRGGVRSQRDPHERAASIGETRLQLESQKTWEKITFTFRADFLYDPVLDHHTVRLNRGTGWLDLREASALLSPLDFLDVKVGRQVLTWGTGDLLFLNDLFPKDWQSFFVGRDVEYLKAPSDALKMSFFSPAANVDVVFVPQFDPDRFIRGRRLSYYNEQLGRRAGRDAIVHADEPDTWFADHEWHARVYRNIEGTELAAYGYWGRWKSPGGFDPARRRATFPRLSVYGASARGQIADGIGNIEAAYYHSRQDGDGDDPFVNNSQVRLLAGYKRDLVRVAPDLSVGLQYYVELMTQHDAYERTLPGGTPADDHARHVITARVTKQLLNQNVTLSLFAYYSPSDSDAYLRPNVAYKIDDHWTVELGGDVFVGAEDHTFFGQFERDSNIYTALRYGF